MELSLAKCDLVLKFSRPQQEDLGVQIVRDSSPLGRALLAPQSSTELPRRGSPDEESWLLWDLGPESSSLPECR